MVGRWSESVIRGADTHTHTTSSSQTREWFCLHQIWWWVCYCWFKLPVPSLTLSFPSFVWTDCASRLHPSDRERQLSGKTYKQNPVQQLSCKAKSFNCSKRKEKMREGVRGLGARKKEQKIKVFWNLFAQCTLGSKRSKTGELLSRQTSLLNGTK